VRLAYIHSTPPESPIGSTDAWGYHRLALNLDRGNGFSLRRQAPYLPDSVRTPLYPAFLLLVRRTLGPSPRTAAIVQALLDGCTTLGTYALAAQIAGMLGTTWKQSRGAGYLAALLYALNPAQIRLVNELLAETLLSFLLTCCLLVLLRYNRLAASGPSRAPRPKAAFSALLLGLLVGLAALCKPNVQFLPLIWLTCLLFARRPRRSARDRPGAKAAGVPAHLSLRQRLPAHWGHAGLAMLAFLSVLTPWLVRNQVVFGRFFLSAAFEGNVSRVSAPATLISARQAYAIPWSADWENAFGQIVAEAGTRFGWDKPWDSLSPRELDAANRQVYRIAREKLIEHPLAWLQSHTLGMLRYLEPKTYRVLHIRLTGRPWPPDILEDAVPHVFREAARGQWASVGQVIGQERWSKLDPLQRKLWWGMFLAQIVASGLMLRGAWRLRAQPIVAGELLGTLVYVLLLPGPIAYERFRAPVLSLIAALIAAATIR
jgi:hypothetical protein